MYVKAGINNDSARNEMKAENGHKQENGLRINNVGDKSEPNLISRRLNGNQKLSSQLDSLNFLHKPQRVKNLGGTLYSDEEIIKNTNLNKNLSKHELPEQRYETGISPTTMDMNGVVSGDENMFLIRPVYKKSGELVKSSLKRRSKSLPTSPHIHNEHKNFTNLPPGGRLKRSKSVHFDHNTPVKYFCEDESPIDVSANAKEEAQEISFKHKPVGCLFSEEDEDENDTCLLSMKIDSLNLNPTAKNPAFRDKTLRKSKRFNAFIKDFSPNPTPQTPSSALDPTSSRVLGLYNVNFPILSNKNPKSLKLNIFINLSQDKKCFLQELTLYVSKDQNSHSTRDQTRMIVGRVLVKNIFFDKKVLIKYTWNAWRTSHDVECVYVGDGDGILPGTNMDLFSFIIDDVNRQDQKAKLEFCIHYITRSDYQRCEFWDNNNGKNYKVDCILDGFTNPFS